MRLLLRRSRYSGGASPAQYLEPEEDVVPRARLRHGVTTGPYRYRHEHRGGSGDPSGPPPRAVDGPRRLRPAPPPPRPNRLPGLDGLRALAIAAVLLFHLDATWLPGRLPRRRRLLRRLGLPHHHAPAPRARGHRTHRPPRLLDPPRPSPPAGARRPRPVLGPARPAHRGRPPRRRRAPGPRRGDLHLELARDRRRHRLLRVHRAPAVHEPLVARGRGAVLPPVAAGPPRPPRRHHEARGPRRHRPSPSPPPPPSSWPCGSTPTPPRASTSAPTPTSSA